MSHLGKCLLALQTFWYWALLPWQTFKGTSGRWPHSYINVPRLLGWGVLRWPLGLLQATLPGNLTLFILAFPADCWLWGWQQLWSWWTKTVFPKLYYRSIHIYAGFPVNVCGLSVVFPHYRWKWCICLKIVPIHSINVWNVHISRVAESGLHRSTDWLSICFITPCE